MKILIEKLWSLLISEIIIDTFGKSSRKLSTTIKGSFKKRIVEKEVKTFLKQRFDESKNEYIYNYIDFEMLNKTIYKHLEDKIIALLFCPSNRIENHIKSDLINEIISNAVIANNLSSYDQNDIEYIIYHYVDTVIKIVKKYYISNDLPKTKNDQMLINYLGISTREIESMMNQIRIDLDDMFELMNDNIKYINSFAYLIDNINELEKNDLKFHYLNQFIGFYGRDNEINMINEFLATNEKISILAITGEGGAGKSKFVYNYILRENYRQDWKMVIIPNLIIKKLCKFSGWYYEKHLLLVFDYASRNAEKIGEFIEMLSTSKTVKNKIRIILLEREGKKEDIYPYWFNRLCDFDRNHYVMEHINLIKLPTLSKEALLKIVEDYKVFLFQNTRDYDKIKYTQMYKKFCNKPFNKSYLNKIYSITNNISNSKITPLNILMVTESVIYGVKNPNKWIKKNKKVNWSQISLAKDALARDYRYWADSIKGLDISIETIEKSIVYATAIGGWDISKSDTDKVKCFFSELIKLNSKNLQSCISIVNEVKDSNPYKIRPLEPDFIGEVLVFEYFMNHIHNFQESQKLIDILWEKPDDFFAFLYRCSNLILESDYKNLILNNIPFYKPSNYYNDHINVLYLTLLNELLYYHSSEKSAKDIFSEFTKIPLNINQNTKHAEIYLRCLLNFSTYIDTLEERLLIIKESEKIISNFPNEPSISQKYVRMLYNITSRFEDEKILSSIVVKIESIYLKFQTEEITRLYALALYNYAYVLENIEEYRITIKKYQNLYESNRYINDIIIYFLYFLEGFSEKCESSKDIEWILEMNDRLLIATNYHKKSIEQYIKTIEILINKDDILNKKMKKVINTKYLELKNFAFSQTK